MGNFQLGRSKDFQSVVPEDGAIIQSPSKKSKSPTNKTAPAPGGEIFVVTNNFPIIDKLPVSVHVATAEKQITNIIQTEPFDFKQTESQLRRKGMADCEFECSQITSYLFVGGYHVAGNWELLKSNRITRIVNCSSAVVENHFINDPSMTYLSINMYDGRQDDIFWFVCDIIQFILKARSLGEKVLVHCEKGVSRSCSFAIAYRMWSAGEKWKTAFEYVKLRRAVCAPNTAFTCNLIEIGEILSNEVMTRNMLFRVAFHLPHDPLTAVLKLCRNAETRKIIIPATSLLDPRGVFVIRATNHDTNNQKLFLWCGTQASGDSVDKARLLSSSLFGIVTNADELLEVQQGSEGSLFLDNIISDGAFGKGELLSPVYDDLYDNKPSMEAALAFQKEHEQIRMSRDRPQTVRESSIKGFETYPEMDSIRKQLSSRELSNRDLDMGGSSHPGKISRIPSLKMGSDSRRSSHSKVAAELSGKYTRPADDLTFKLNNLIPTNGNSGGSDAVKSADDRKGVVKLDFVSMGGTPLALQLGSLPQLDESPLPSSRRGSVSGDDAHALLSSRAISLKMPSRAVESVQPVLPEPGTARRSLIDKIADAIGGDVEIAEKSSPRVEQQTSIRPKVPSLLPVSIVSEVVPEDSLKSDKDDSSNLRQPELSTGVALLSARSMLKIPQQVGPEAQSKGVIHEDEVMLRSPSKLRMLSFLVGGGSESRPSADGPSLFRNNSRVVPLPTSDETERKLSTTTDSTQTMSRLASPSSAMTRGDSQQILNLSLSPAAQHKVSNSVSTPIPGLLMRTPSTDRHPDHVGLSRGPTPAEDLVATSSRHNSARDGANAITHLNNGPSALSKPTLFQVISRENRKLSRASRKDASRVFEWQAMGVYDDEDLTEGCVLLLLCPELPHFLWVGSEFDFSMTGINVEEEGVGEDSLLRWAASVLPGEVHFKDTVGSCLSVESLSINKSGEESDAFWAAFNDGY